MKSGRFITLTSIAFLLFESCVFGAQARENILLQSQTAKLDVLPPPKLLKGGVGQAVMQGEPSHKTNVLGYSQEGANFPKKVTYVEPNSLAWRAGLQANDKIIKDATTPTYAGMVVQRGSKKYICIMDLRQLVPKKTDTIKGGATTGTAPSQSQPGLAKYSLVMMVDDSASMGTADCPDGKTRWQWCREHVRDLYTAKDSTLQKNISIITFDSNFRSFRDCAPGRLTEVFEKVTPAGETNMAPALEESFALVRSQLDHGGPAMITLISDGRPSDVDAVKRSIISETNRINHPDLLSIVFIEVGTPEKYLKELDNDLVTQGAKKDIVSVIPFATVSAQPLFATLSTEAAKFDEQRNPPKVQIGSVTASGAAANTSGASAGQAPVKAKIVTPQPPIKAHPTGTSAEPEPKVVVKVPVKPVEVDEKEVVLKDAANKRY